MSTPPSVAYFIVSRTETNFTEICAYPDGRCTLRETYKGEILSEIFLCEFDPAAVEEVQSKLDQLAEFISETNRIYPDHGPAKIDPESSRHWFLHSAKDT